MSISPEYEYIEVAVSLPVDGTYTYRVPQPFLAIVAVAKRVLVPFHNRTVTGYILALHADGGPSAGETKYILDVLDEKPLFTTSLIPLFKWIARYYMYPLGQVITKALPAGINDKEVTSLKITGKGAAVLSESGIPPLAEQVLTRLVQGPNRLKTLSRQIGCPLPAGLILSMEKKGWIVTRRYIQKGTPVPRTERYLSLIRSDIPQDRYYPQRKAILEAIESEGEISLTHLKKRVQSGCGSVRYLTEKGFIQTCEKKVYTDPLGELIEPDSPPPLTLEQETVISSISGAMGKGFCTYLLEGVTGSGKTEVYMQIAAEAVQNGFSVLVLVPEIALISQTERRFRARFGQCIALLHSGLTKTERFDQWKRIMDQEASIIIGVRSAVFAPLDQIGVIIVDEEHDPSYKQDGSFSYNARDLAVMRAKFQNCIALLGSATPSIQSVYNVVHSKFKGLQLRHRVNQQPLPEIRVVDLREYRDMKGMNRYLTPDLVDAMKQTLQRGEQVLLFLNRRGFANFAVCSECGKAIRCKNCDISMTLHQKANAYKCHFCGYTRPFGISCPDCGSSKIYLLGLGTEKLEAGIKALFPDRRIARMDRDTTLRKGALITLLKGLRNRTIDILIGTQMVAKGHDFPHITLVGIICADLSLNFPDFRSGERTFQLLAQVAGRAGRGETPGKVILQTYTPDHYSIECSRDQDVEGFYNREIEFRKSLNYPPFSRMIQLNISGRDKNDTKRDARILGECSFSLMKANPAFMNQLEQLGPVESPLAKIANRFRWQILYKSPNVGLLHEFVRKLMEEKTFKSVLRQVTLAVDVDPFFMM
ncbi:MAG: primosomal protein N' [Desulfobacterales bacterium]|nr:primosomal protein N' [Desulfobacterales bacterium]MDD4072404.1 primosomal protein N' [Desulfobacterales bacterium]MDD4393294.1 primosomal protein N' [Desulfobacterales bacterium]